MLDVGVRDSVRSHGSPCVKDILTPLPIVKDKLTLGQGEPAWVGLDALASSVA